MKKLNKYIIISWIFFLVGKNGEMLNIFGPFENKERCQAYQVMLWYYVPETFRFTYCQYTPEKEKENK